MRERQLLIEAALDLGDPLRTHTRNRERVPVTLNLQLPAALTKPRLPSLRPSHEPLRVKLKLDLGDDLFARVDLGLALGLQPLPGSLKGCATTLTRAQLLRHLIATPIAEPLVVLTVGLLGLFEHLLNNRSVAAVAVIRRARADLRPVNTDLPE